MFNLLVAEASPAGWPVGTRRVILDECRSTNAEAMERAYLAPCWVMARNQTGGRGRRGRAWESRPGNLAASLVLSPAGRTADAARLAFVAALALGDAMHDVAGPALALALKWPNDVLLNGGKLAGILLESSGRADHIDKLVIGFGVNLASAPEPAEVEPDAMRPVSLAAETGLTVPPEHLLDALAPAFAQWRRRLQIEGFGAIRAAWTARAARLGESVTARVGHDSITGIMTGIDAEGALILETTQGRRAIPAAEIHF